MVDPLAILGTAQLTSEYGVANRSGPPSRIGATELLRAAATLGYDAIDTAPTYGAAEEVIGAAELRVPVYTKAHGPGVRASVESSLSRLRRDHIDVLFLHDPDLALRDPEGVIDEASSLVGSSVGTLGASVYTVEQLRSVIADSRIGCVQVPVNAVDRRMVDVITESGIVRPLQVFARSAFLQGALLLAPDALPDHLSSLRDHIRAIRDVARLANVSVPALLLAFVALLPQIDGIIVGCESQQQARTSLLAIRTASTIQTAIDGLPALRLPPDDVLDPRTWPTVRRSSPR